MCTFVALIDVIGQEASFHIDAGIVNICLLGRTYYILHRVKLENKTSDILSNFDLRLEVKLLFFKFLSLPRRLIYIIFW